MVGVALRDAENRLWKWLWFSTLNVRQVWGPVESSRIWQIFGLIFLAPFVFYHWKSHRTRRIRNQQVWVWVCMASHFRLMKLVPHIFKDIDLFRTHILHGLSNCWGWKPRVSRICSMTSIIVWTPCLPCVRVGIPPIISQLKVLAFELSRRLCTTEH